MSNQQLVKSAHIWALALVLAGGFWAIAGKAGIRFQEQNSNQNSNTNPNANKSQNANKTANRNTRANENATGEQTGMANMTSQDRNFIMDAAMGGMMEVELGRLADLHIGHNWKAKGSDALAQELHEHDLDALERPRHGYHRWSFVCASDASYVRVLRRTTSAHFTR